LWFWDEAIKEEGLEMLLSKKIVWGLIFFLVLSLVVFKEKSLIPRKTNVILITFDALRADHLGSYGYLLPTSPYLDAFSKNSLVFQNCIAQSASTVPALAALFTSRYPFLDGAVTEDYALGGHFLTLADFLKEHGYYTMAILGHEYVKKKFGFSRGFNAYDDHFEKWRNADDIVRIVETSLRKNKISQKFFLWIHIREPHSPYDPPERFKMFNFPPLVGLQDETQEYTIYGRKERLTRQRIGEFISLYDGNIRFADEALGRILAHLEREGFLRDAVVVLTADHGESLGEHNIFDHNNLFYKILQVPLLIKMPKGKKGLVRDPVCAIDIFPTILDILGYREDISKLNLRGRSLLRNKAGSSVQFSEYPQVYSIIKDGWRFWVDLSEKKERLFNILMDPLEMRDQWNAYEDKARSLSKDLQDILAAAGNTATASVSKMVILNNKDLENLRSLGYLQ
jgi:arylsulfatase